MDVLELLRGLADSWLFCLGMAGIAVYSLLPEGRVPTASLAVPALGFVLRKILLFVPVCGAVSTADQVVFWSPGAWVFHVLLLGWLLAMPIGFRAAIPNAIEGPGCFFVLALVVLFALAYLLLPLDGWGILFMPLVALFSLIKMCLVSPALLVACWVGLLAQVGALLLPRWLPGRFVNAALVSAVGLLGAVALLGQGFALLHWRQPSPIVEAIRAAPFVLPPPKPALPGERPLSEWQRKWIGAKYLFDSRRSDYPEWFLALWRDRLREIARTGVQVVEKDIALAELPPLPSTFPTAPGPWVALAAGVFVLVLLAMDAEGRAIEARRIPTIPKNDLAGVPLHSFRLDELQGGLRRAFRCQEWTWPDALDDLRSSQSILGTLLLAAGAFTMLVVIAIVPSLWSGWSYRFEVGIVADILMGAAALVALFTFLDFVRRFVPPIFERQEDVVAATDLLHGHRRGQVVSPDALRLLTQLSSNLKQGDSLLDGQPPVILLACLDDSTNWLRQHALRLLPTAIIVREAKRLAESPHEDCRSRIARSRLCPHQLRMRLIGDKSQAIRSQVMHFLGDLASKELDQLIGSPWLDIRQFVLQHPNAGPRQWVELAARDADTGTREAARKLIPNPSADERTNLLASMHFDTRLFAVALPGITSEELRQRCADPDPTVAKAAFSRYAALATEQDLESVAINPALWEDLLAHPRMPASRVKQMLIERCRDTDVAAARAALTRLLPLLSETEIVSLAFNPAIWRDLVSHPRTPHRRVAEVLEQFIPGVYIVDVPAEGYEDPSFARYGISTWVEIHAEIGHHEYGADDIALASRLIDAVPGRRASVLAHLSVIKPDLHDKLSTL